MPKSIRSAGYGINRLRPPGQTKPLPRSWSGRRRRLRPAPGWRPQLHSCSRSVLLTAEPERRAERALAAAQAHVQAGAFDTALALLTEAKVMAVTMCSGPEPNGSGGRSCTHPTPGPRRPSCCWRPPTGSRHLISSWRGRRTWTHGWRHFLPVVTLGPVVSCRKCQERHDPPRRQGGRRRPGICSSTGSPGGHGWAGHGRPSLRRAMDTFLGDQLSVSDWLQWGHLATHAA